MRFLQTEWHRHERDRNAWEIERQEMRGRIATLEGQARRSDATQKALQKYVGILQNKVREQTEQLQGIAPRTTEGDREKGQAADADKDDRAARIKEKLKGEFGMRCANCASGWPAGCARATGDLIYICMQDPKSRLTAPIPNWWRTRRRGQSLSRSWTSATPNSVI